MAADRPIDRYPLMTLDYALAALKVRFGADNVVEEKGQVTLKLMSPGRQAHALVSLTVAEAKFLVAHSISAKDLVDENYPTDWPGDPRLRTKRPRPAHRGAEPLEFKPPPVEFKPSKE
jgi:hypothetical protein